MPLQKRTLQRQPTGSVSQVPDLAVKIILPINRGADWACPARPNNNADAAAIRVNFLTAFFMCLDPTLELIEPISVQRLTIDVRKVTVQPTMPSKSVMLPTA